MDDAGDRLTGQVETIISNNAPNIIKSTLSPSAKEFVPAHLQSDETIKNRSKETDEKASSEGSRGPGTTDNARSVKPKKQEVKTPVRRSKRIERYRRYAKK